MSDHLDLDTSQVSAKLRRLIQQMPQARNKLLSRVALAVESNAEDRCPVDTGALKAALSSIWHGGENPPEPAPEGGETPTPFPLRPVDGEAYVYNTMDYAAAVHEDLDAHHDVGEAKFIERALLEVGAGEMAETIARNLLDELR